MISNKIIELRKESDLTQAKLSSLSGVSLAYLQRVEYGQANPSFDVLSRLLGAMGYELTIQDAAVDWDVLVAMGVPLSPKKVLAPISDPAVISRCIRQAFRHAKESPETRLQIALEAWAMALRDHFPTFFKIHFGPSFSASSLKNPVTGLHIKLRRIALSKLKDII